MKIPKVTVLVTSFNYEQYIKKRIENIFNQTYKNIELIVIDDHSEDASDQIIRELQSKYSFRYICNASNSGSPFSSWQKILSLATGEYIWICESDDFAENRFLETALAALTQNKAAVIFYCGSHLINEEGKTIGDTDTYFHEVWRETRWDNDFVNDGRDEYYRYQQYGQSVPNISSALISTEAYKRAFRPIITRFKLTGDWLFVGYLLLQGSVIFSSEKLNYFRSHAGTCRSRTNSARSQAEFLLTKYLLFREENSSMKRLIKVIKNDAVRMMHESASVVSILKEMFAISRLNFLTFLVNLCYSSLLNFSLVRQFFLRYMTLKGEKKNA